MKTLTELNSLDHKIQKDFLAFLSRNQGKKNSRLHSITKNIIDLKGTDIQVLHKNLILKKLVPTDYSGNLFRKDLHDIQSELYDFLSLKALKLSKYDKLRYRNKAIKLYLNQAHEKIKFFDVELNNATIHSSEQLSEAYLMQSTKLDLANYPKSLNDISEYPKKVSNAINNLDILYHIESYKLSIFLQCNEFNTKRKFSYSEQSSPPSPSTINLEKSPLLAIYHNLHLLLSNEEANVNLAKELISSIEIYEDLENSEFNTIFEGLVNYFIFQLNRGISSLINEEFALWKIAVNKGLYDQNIDAAIYRNICFISSRAGELNWALKFANDYKNRIPKNESTNAYTFSKARILINMGRHSDVIETLRSVEYKDITYNLNSKLMLMTSFYELKEFEPLIATIKAFKVFLRRRRNISKARKTNFNGYCDVLFNIVKAEENFDMKRIRKAKEILDEIPSIPNSSLLREKIALVEKKL